MLSLLAKIFRRNMQPTPAGPTQPPERGAHGECIGVDDKSPLMQPSFSLTQPAQHLIPLRLLDEEGELMLFTAWLGGLIGGPPFREGPMGALEELVLDHLCAMLDTAFDSADMLPRAAAVVPQLLAMLCGPQQSLEALAQQVSKDKVLTAEVFRMVATPSYGNGRSVKSLDDAVNILGVAGLKSAIAKVVFKPIYRSKSTGLMHRVGKPLQTYSELQAQHMAKICAKAGQDRFLGYLAGLMHGSGLTVAFCGMDRIGPHWPLPLSLDFVRILHGVKDGLYAKVVRAWDLDPALNEMCDQISRCQPSPDTGLLSLLLRSQREVMSARR